MHMAVACGAEAVSKGATGVKCTAVRNGYPTLEEMIRFVKMRGADLDIETGMRVTEIHRVVTQLEKIIMPQEEEITRFSNISLPDAAGVTLDEKDEIGEVIKVVRQLGYDLSEEDNAKVYEAFRRVVTKKHFVGTKELDAIVADHQLCDQQREYHHGDCQYPSGEGRREQAGSGNRRRPDRRCLCGN